MNRVERADKTNLLSYVQTWVLCAVLLVFASVYGFSFERGSLNTEVGSATFGIAAPDAQQGALMAAQNGLVYLLAVLCIFPLARQVWERFQSSILITLLIVWAFCSALWSSNPSTTIVNSTRLGICIALTMYLVERVLSQRSPEAGLAGGYGRCCGKPGSHLPFSPVWAAVARRLRPGCLGRHLGPQEPVWP